MQFNPGLKLWFGAASRRHCWVPCNSSRGLGGPVSEHQDPEPSGRSDATPRGTGGLGQGEPAGEVTRHGKGTPDPGNMAPIDPGDDFDPAAPRSLNYNFVARQPYPPEKVSNPSRSNRQATNAAGGRRSKGIPCTRVGRCQKTGSALVGPGSSGYLSAGGKRVNGGCRKQYRPND